MSRSTRKAAQAKAAATKARSDANPRQGEAGPEKLARMFPMGSQPARRRGQGRRPICTTCKERRVGPSADAMNIGPPGMCDRCYEEAGLENEHSDFGHETPVQGCPTCGLSTVGQAPADPKSESTSRPKRTRKPKDPSRPSKYEVAEKYGDRILKGRHEFGYTWQGIAEVLHLIPRGEDVPRNVKVWGHVVVWDAYLIVCAQRGIEPQRKVVRGSQKSNGNAVKDTAPKYNPNAAPKPARQSKSKEEKLNHPAKNKDQRKRKALGLEELGEAELKDRLEGRTITYTFALAGAGTAEATVAQFVKRDLTGKGKPAVWFYETISVDEKAKRTFASNLRTVYLDQIVEVS